MLLALAAATPWMVWPVPTSTNWPAWVSPPVAVWVALRVWLAPAVPVEVMLLATATELNAAAPGVYCSVAPPVVSLPLSASTVAELDWVVVTFDAPPTRPKLSALAIASVLTEAAPVWASAALKSTSLLTRLPLAVWLKFPVSPPPPRLSASLALALATVVTAVTSPELAATFSEVLALVAPLMVWLDWTSSEPVCTALSTPLPVAVVTAVVEPETSTTFRVWVEKTSPSWT